MKSIPQICQLYISDCELLSRIVAEENGLGESLVDEVEFPHLARLTLRNLPNLVSFFPKVTTTPQPLFNGKVAIPSLKELEGIDCENLRHMFHPSVFEALANLEKLVIRKLLKDGSSS